MLEPGLTEYRDVSSASGIDARTEPEGRLEMQTRVAGVKYGAWGREKYGVKPAKVDAMEVRNCQGTRVQSHACKCVKHISRCSGPGWLPGYATGDEEWRYMLW